eukprot:g32283.t1
MVFAELDAKSRRVVKDLAEAVVNGLKPVIWQASIESQLQKKEKFPLAVSMQRSYDRVGDRRERRVRGLPKKALHMELEKTQEFLPEEFFDALMPVWQEITEGQGPRYSPPECQCNATSLAQQMMYAPVRPRLRVRLQGVKDEEEEDDLERAEDCTIRQALLGRGQLPAARAESGPLEVFLSRAQSGSHDELLAENLELRKENEVLRCQVESPSKRPPSGFASPKSCRQNSPAPGSSMSPSKQVRSPLPEGEPVPEAAAAEAVVAEFADELAQEIEARSTWRDVSPISPTSILNVATAAFSAVRGSLSPSNSPARSGRSERGTSPERKAGLSLPPGAKAPSRSSSPQRKPQVAFWN